MSVLFCVPAIGQEQILKQKIAGLCLWERLYQHAKRAGMTPLFILGSDSSLKKSVPDDAYCTDYSKFSCRGFGIVVLCRADVLPEIECLKYIASMHVPMGHLLEDKGLAVFSPSKDCLEFERAFAPNGFHELLKFVATYMEKGPLRCNKGKIYHAGDPLSIKELEDHLFKGLIKDTEGFMSRHVERRISLFISKRLVNTSVTPNQVTVISTIIGLIGAFFISLGQGLPQIFGSILFLVHSIVDGCDGEIARIKFMESRLGGVMDFWGDNIVHAAVFWAIGLEWAMRSGALLPLYLGAMAVAGTFLSAAIVYFTTMRKKTEGPLYTSVSESEQARRKSRLIKVADFLSRRDFIYLVVILAFLHHLDWFLVAASFGSIAFAGALLWIRFKG